MRRTKKYEAALKSARPLKIKTDCEQATLYERLEGAGLAWDSKTGVWGQAQSSSVFADDAAGDVASGVIKLRLMAHPANAEAAAERVKRALKAVGIAVTEISKPYPNRRGAGVRLYLDALDMEQLK
jgi:hypothetical protein